MPLTDGENVTKMVASESGEFIFSITASKVSIYSNDIIYIYHNYLHTYIYYLHVQKKIIISGFISALILVYILRNKRSLQMLKGVVEIRINN